MQITYRTDCSTILKRITSSLTHVVLYKWSYQRHPRNGSYKCLLVLKVPSVGFQFTKRLSNYEIIVLIIVRFLQITLLYTLQKHFVGIGCFVHTIWANRRQLPVVCALSEFKVLFHDENYKCFNIFERARKFHQ